MVEKIVSEATPWLLVDRLMVDAQGETHFVKCRVPDEGEQVNVAGIKSVFSSIPIGAEFARIRCLPEGTDAHHSAPERRLVAILSGTMEITASDGEIRRWNSGDVLLATDTGGGKGHRIRALDGAVVTVFVRIADDIDLDAWTVV